MRKVLGVIGIIFVIFICVVLIENYGITHTDTKVILIDTCFVDSSKIDTNISVFDTLVVKSK